MILAIDVGNTRIKWGVRHQEWLAQGAFAHDEMNRLTDVLHGIRRAVVSNVAGSAVEEALKAVLAPVPTLWIKSSASACGVKNGYDTPSQLGSDRWAALIAAWHIVKSPCIVVSAGTALTIDALSEDGTFPGGLIIPGLAAMRSALIANTQLNIADGRLDDFPANTGDAVLTGALRAMAGAVLAQYQSLADRSESPPRLLLTGGDARELQMLLPEGELSDNLVLQGLLLLDKEFNQ